MSAVIVNLPVRHKAVPRKPDPLAKGCVHHACAYCGNQLFVVLSSFDGDYTAVKCNNCGAVGMDVSPCDGPEAA